MMTALMVSSLDVVRATTDVVEFHASTRDDGDFGGDGTTTAREEGKNVRLFSTVDEFGGDVTRRRPCHRRRRRRRRGHRLNESTRRDATRVVVFF